MTLHIYIFREWYGDQVMLTVARVFIPHGCQVPSADEVYNNELIVKGLTDVPEM